MTDNTSLLEQARAARAQQVTDQQLIDRLPQLEKEATARQKVDAAQNRADELRPVIDESLGKLKSDLAARDHQIKLLAASLDKLIGQSQQCRLFADHTFGQIKNLIMLTYIAKSESYNGDDVQSLSEQYLIDRALWPLSKFSGSVARGSSLGKILGILGL